MLTRVIIEAVYAIMRSRFQFGYETLAAVTEKYKSEPWFSFVRADIAGIVIHMSEAEIRQQGPRLCRVSSQITIPCLFYVRSKHHSSGFLVKTIMMPLQRLLTGFARGERLDNAYDSARVTR